MRIHLCALSCCLVLAGSVCAADDLEKAGAGGDSLYKAQDAPFFGVPGKDVKPSPPRMTTPEKVISHTLWYVPNRLLDLLDIFRLKARVGPGLSGELRVTDYASFHLGPHRTAWAGLPGARYPDKLTPLWGLEAEDGIVFFGVNATDTTPHEPRYSPSEMTLGVQLLLIGGSIGLDPVEIGDFLGGFILKDWRLDDLGKAAAPAIKLDRTEQGWTYYLKSKPGTFDSFSDRLDYINTNFYHGLNLSTREIDTMFFDETFQPEHTPASRFRLGMFAEFEVDGGLSFALDPDFDLEVDLPNIENNWHIFLTGKEVGELPNTDPSERESGFSIGVGSKRGKRHIKADAGIRVKVPPVGFASLEWRPHWKAGQWGITPQIKGYYETDEGFGQVSGLHLLRWFGSRDEFAFISSSSGKWTETTIGWEWDQTFKLGYIPSLLDESQRNKGSISTHDAKRIYGVRTTVNGQVDSQDIITRYRLTFSSRKPLYKDWIFLEISPEVKWENENDWDPVPLIRVGLDMLFWGPGSPAPPI